MCILSASPVIAVYTSFPIRAKNFTMKMLWPLIFIQLLKAHLWHRQNGLLHSRLDMLIQILQGCRNFFSLIKVVEGLN